jgi:hypothetical protein
MKKGMLWNILFLYCLLYLEVFELLLCGLIIKSVRSTRTQIKKLISQGIESDNSLYFCVPFPQFYKNNLIYK